MTITIDAAKALDLLAGAVKARGEDYMYDAEGRHGGACYYATDGKPDCMVGQALADAGVPIDTLNALNPKGAFAQDAVDYLRGNDVDITPGARKVFRAAQRRQDMGVLWGSAYRNAEDAAKFEIALERGDSE
jgi:hypothetical protein